MRKILLSLVAFLSGVGAWAGVTDLPEITADPANPIYYTIYNTRSSQPGGLMYYAGDAVGLKDGCTSTTLEDKYKFYFTGSHEEMYVHNAATGKKLASVESWTDEGIAWAVGVSPKGGGLAVGPQGGLSGWSCWNEKNFATDATTSDFTIYSANDAGSIFVFERADEWVFAVETGKIYTIECPVFEKVQGVKKGMYVKDDGSLAWGTVDHMNKNFLWVATVNADGTVVFKNLGTEKFLGAAAMSETAENATIYALGSNQFNIKVTVPNAEGTGTETHTLHANGHGSGANASGNIVNYGGAAGSASGWRFVEHADPDAVTHVTVTYNFMYKGVSKGTQTVELLDGDEYPGITTEFPWGVQATKPEGTVDAAEAVDGVVTKDIEVTANTPFVCNASYGEITTWYYLKFRPDSPHYLYYNPDLTYMDASKSTPDYDNIDAYAWAYVGNPFDGFQLVNKAAGEGIVLTSAEPTEDKIFPIMAEGTQVWDLSASTHGTNGFYMAYDGTTKRLNRQDNKVCYWLAGADVGSTFEVEAIDITGMSDLAPVLAKAKVLQAAVGTAVGNITAESAEDLNTAMTNAEEAVTAGTGGFVCLNPLNAAIANLKTVQPDPAKYYRIVSNCTRDDRAGQLVYVANNGQMHFETEGNSATTLGYVFQFEDAGEGKFYMYNVERGVYAHKFSNPALANAVDNSAAKKVTITNKGESNIVTIQPDGENMMHAQDASSLVVAWNSSELDGASAWKIEEVDIATVSHPVTIGEAGWATLYLGYDAAVPEGVTAYAVSATSANAATLTEVSGVIPANCAVLLNGAAATYDFKVATTEPSAVTNVLVGSVFNTNVEGVGYVLADGTSGVGLYKAALDKGANGAVEEGTEPTHFLNNAFKAYLPASAVPADSRFFLLDFGTVTGIENIEGVENTNAAVYDLSGRRVNKATKGIFIINGKKVIK